MGSVISTDVPDDLKEQIEAEQGEDARRAYRERRDALLETQTTIEEAIANV